MLESIIRGEPVGFAALVAVIGFLALAIALGVARWSQGKKQNRIAVSTLKREWEYSDREADPR